MGLREQFFGACKKPPAPVTLPHSGLTVYVRTLSAADFYRVRHAAEGQGDFVGVLVGACNEDGSRLFADEDLDAIRDADALDILTIVGAVAKHNRVDGVEDDAKN